MNIKRTACAPFNSGESYSLARPQTYLKIRRRVVVFRWWHRGGWDSVWSPHSWDSWGARCRYFGLGNAIPGRDRALYEFCRISPVSLRYSYSWRDDRIYWSWREWCTFFWYWCTRKSQISYQYHCWNLAIAGKFFAKRHFLERFIVLSFHTEYSPRGVSPSIWADYPSPLLWVDQFEE